jgi:hypothetical protein
MNVMHNIRGERHYDPAPHERLFTREIMIFVWGDTPYGRATAIRETMRARMAGPKGRLP